VTDDGATLTGDAPTLYTIFIANELAASVPGVRRVHSELAVARPANAPTDAEIKNHAEHILRWNASISAGKVNVSVVSGRMALEGEVVAYWQRSRAEALMLDIEGVVGVDNNLLVVPELVPQDQVIATDVQSAIARYSCADQNSITVEVSHGRVTLSGNVPNWWSKQNTSHLVEYILGVKGVVDRLVVEQPE
jgi:osmotically-inducible protein OsmY